MGRLPLKGNLSDIKILFGYLTNISISRLYWQLLRNGSAMAVQKNFRLLKYERIIYNFEARDLEISNMGNYFREFIKICAVL